jgi:superfamily II DNA or RNA helicase
MTFDNPAVRRNNYYYSIIREYDEWGIKTADLATPPKRFWSNLASPPPVVKIGIDINRLSHPPSPASLLTSLPQDDNWSAQSRRSIARLWAHFLICEDPQRRLDAREVETLSHQISLIKHILDHEKLRSVMIADEVGLGKTIEAGLLLKELLEQNGSLRVLYLAPARLVFNVCKELHRLGLDGFRQWKSGESDAKLSDQLIVASIHRAVHVNNYSRFIEAAPWDVLIVDECHHLSDWADGGGDPVEKFKLVRDVIAQQRPESRVIFMSGTPHQGHMARFNNLLGLLKRQGEDAIDLTGRVIYRTKEDVKDWFGRPLFPQRQVNTPVVVDLGNRYQSWLQNIYSYYNPSDANEKQRRAAGWRCAQALQWAASSPQAGLGYLVRQALRAGWGLDERILKDALFALRPYRSGSEDEPVADLFSRMQNEVVIQQQEVSIEDIEEDTDVEMTASDRVALRELLKEGLSILTNDPYGKWLILKREIIDKANGEKIVFFAQPIETVTALVHYFKKELNVEPVIIIGGQSENDRDAQIKRFWSKDGPRFLVSSRAGGEGLNLQVARRLVHLDVPWNPMEMEQRVGRVHRFGSKQTIIVDTLVAKNSREADAFRVARQKLGIIARDMGGPERSETIFSRVMSLVAPEEFQDVLLDNPFEALTEADANKLAAMVEAGFQQWRSFHDKFADQQRAIKVQNPGLALWSDVIEFLKEYGRAEAVDKVVGTKFVVENGKVVTADERIDAILLNDGKVYFSGDHDGLVVLETDDKETIQLGLNRNIVTQLLRKTAFPEIPAGAAYLRFPKNINPSWMANEKQIGCLILLRQQIRLEHHVNWVEVGNALHCFVVYEDRRYLEFFGNERGLLLRTLFQSTIRKSHSENDLLSKVMKDTEARLATELRRPQEEEFKQGIRYAITPLFAGIFCMN